MRELRLVALVLLLLSGVVCLAAQSDPALSGYVCNYHNSDYDYMAARSIFLCSDNSVVAFSNWDNHEWEHYSGSAIIKIDPDGNLLWENELYADWHHSAVTGIDVDEDDNVTYIHEGDGTFRLHMVSSNGIKSAIGPSISTPQVVTFNKALRTGDGDIVAIGRIVDPYWNPAPLKAACYYRLSAQGDTLATAYWPSSAPHYRASAYDLALMDNGNLLITCSLSTEYNSILEINLDGEIINRYDIPYVFDAEYGLAISREANALSYLIAYSVDDGVSIDRFSGGSLEHLFSVSNSVIEYVSSIIVRPDYIILCGARALDGVLVKTDLTGDIIWTWSHTGQNHSDYNELGVQSKSLLAVDDSDCVYWTWGSCYSQAVVKLLPNGQVANQDEVQAPAANMLTAYPNPMKNQLSIKADPSLRGESIEVYNIRGELVRRLKLTDSETIWDGKDSSGRNCPSGVYLLRSNNVKNQVKKISKIN